MLSQPRLFHCKTKGFAAACRMPRGGDSGLRQHRRQLLFEFSECLKTVTEVRNPTHLQLQAHHACHQVIAHATSLKGSIWDYTSSRSLGVDAGVEAWLVDRILSRDLSVPVPPVHSPVAANSGSSTAARPTQRSRSPRPSSSTHPPQVVGGATLIQASGPREAADDLLQVFGIQGGQSEQIAQRFWTSTGSSILIGRNRAHSLALCLEKASTSGVYPSAVIQAPFHTCISTLIS